MSLCDYLSARLPAFNPKTTRELTNLTISSDVQTVSWAVLQVVMANPGGIAMDADMLSVATQLAACPTLNELMVVWVRMMRERCGFEPMHPDRIREFLAMHVVTIGSADGFAAVGRQLSAKVVQFSTEKIKPASRPSTPPAILRTNSPPTSALLMTLQ